MYRPAYIPQDPYMEEGGRGRFNLFILCIYLRRKHKENVNDSAIAI